MATGYAKFRNDEGVPTIAIGVKEFKCAGATPPHDHPHVYLNMGSAGSIHCPYCGTLYVYKAGLRRDETQPPGNFLEDELEEA